MVLNKYQIDPDDEIGIVAFESCAYKLLDLCPMTNNKPLILQKLQSLTTLGGTDINKGLVMAESMFDWSRNDVVRRIVLLTDGDGGDPLLIAMNLKSRGLVLGAIGIGDSPRNVNEKLLRRVASVIEGENRYRFIKDSDDLVNHYTQLANKTSTCA